MASMCISIKQFVPKKLVINYPNIAEAKTTGPIIEPVYEDDSTEEFEKLLRLEMQ